MKVFLTGGTGFIGSHVAMALLEQGHAVTIFARKADKVPALARHPGVTIRTGLLTDHAALTENLSGHDAVIHVALGWGDAATDMLRNDTLPSVGLLEACAHAGVKHFIYTSSTAALGDLSGDVAETTTVAPADYYGATKAATEAFLFAVACKSRMRCNIIRPGYTFGNPAIEGAPVQSDRRFHDIVAAACASRPVCVIRNDGTQFIHATDLARLYLAVLGATVNRQIYFGLGARFVSWESIAHEAVRLARTGADVMLADKGYGKRPNFYRVQKIRKQFGFVFDPRRAITEHLEYLVEERRKEMKTAT